MEWTTFRPICMPFTLQRCPTKLKKQSSYTDRMFNVLNLCFIFLPLLGFLRLENWCLTCESVANLSCYFSNPNHYLLTIRGSTLKEAEDLQKLIKEIPLKKALAIQKRKQVQAHLNSLMQSLKQVEDGLKEQMVKNDLHLAGLMSLDENGHCGLPQDNKDLTVATAREMAAKIALQCEESLSDVTRIADYFDSHKRIRILLNLRNVENQAIPTFSLFEDGFYSNWSTTENLSTTDRNLMLLSHLVFSILKRWNIVLKVNSSPGSLFAAAALPSTESRLPPPPPSTVLAASGIPLAAGMEQASFNKTSPNSNSLWGSAPVLSYSQVLNLPKPPELVKQFCLTNGNLPSFTFRFGQKGNGKFNVPSKFLGDVLVKMTLSSHVTFIKELVHFCRKPREVARRIIKV